MILMLYLSVKNISPMTTNDKKNALKKTLESLKIRFDINDKTSENQELLKENIPVNVDEELDLKSIVGKVIEGRAFDRSTRMLKMRRILL